MPAPSFLEAPEFFQIYRASLEPADPVRFTRLLELTKKAVNAELTAAFYESKRPGSIGQTEGPRNLADLEAGIEAEVERCNFGHLPDGRPIDARIYTEDSWWYQNIGVLALVGTHWRPVTTLEQKVKSGSDAAPALANLGSAVAERHIDALWVMSRDEGLNWVTSYDEGQPASNYELDQLIGDLELI